MKIDAATEKMLQAAFDRAVEWCEGWNCLERMSPERVFANFLSTLEAVTPAPCPHCNGKGFVGAMGGTTNAAGVGVCEHQWREILPTGKQCHLCKEVHIQFYHGE